MISCPLPSRHQAALALGATDFLSKPISTRQLWAAVDHLPQPVNSALIVDDDLEAVRLYQRILRTRIPIDQLREAYNGREALQRMREQRPDLVLLDLGMPVMDGQAVLDRMASDPDLVTVPVIVISAGGQDRVGMPLPGSVEISRLRGFPLGESVRLLGAVLSELSRGWRSLDPTVQVPAEVTAV